MFNIINDNIIRITRGDTGYFSVKLFKDGKDYTLGDKDTLVFSVKRRTTDSETLIRKELLASTLIRINPVDTKDLQYGTYYYDVQVTFENGDVNTVVQPTRFIILEEVTF